MNSRAEIRAHWERQAVQHERTRDMLPHVVVSTRLPGSPAPCPEAAALHDMVLTEPVLFPLSGCDRERCHCGWRSATPREIERRRR